MSEARRRVDERLANGEISVDDHKRIVAQLSDSGDAEVKRQLNDGFLLGGGFALLLIGMIIAGFSKDEGGEGGVIFGVMVLIGGVWMMYRSFTGKWST